MMFGLGAEIYRTSEARVCPDGSTVGRGGPNCEFAPCPSVDVVTPPKQLVVGGTVTPAEQAAQAGCKWWEEYYPIYCIAGTACPQCRASRGLLAGTAIVVGLVLWGLFK